jgi:hypothetical protein
LAPQYSSPRLVCTSCGHETDIPDRVKPGTGWLTATLLFLMVVPGVVYWVWRNTMKENRCPLCNRATLIPTASPIGRAILASPYRLADPAITPQPQDVRLERIEQAIDAIAIEVERVAESQRYAARQLGPSP